MINYVSGEYRECQLYMYLCISRVCIMNSAQDSNPHIQITFPMQEEQIGLKFSENEIEQRIERITGLSVSERTHYLILKRIF